MKCERVPGSKKNHQVRIFTLSTCGWCKKTKELLKSLDIEYEYVDVDKLTGDDIETVRDEVKNIIHEQVILRLLLMKEKESSSDLKMMRYVRYLDNYGY